MNGTHPPAPRVVSLVPSVTETLLAWGVTPIAVTRFCEQPGLRTVGGTKNPDIEAIIGLQPDLVVVDREENRRDDAEALGAAGIDLVVLHVTSYAGVATALDTLAAALGFRSPPPAPLPEGTGPEPTGAEVKGAGTPPAVFVPIWRRPWMTIASDTYGSTLLAAAGARNVFAGAPTRYPEISLEDAGRRKPDLVLAPSEPYPFSERHRRELEVVGPVVFVDGKDLFWWGVRSAAALSRLAGLLGAPRVDGPPPGRQGFA